MELIPKKNTKQRARAQEKTDNPEEQEVAI